MNERPVVLYASDHGFGHAMRMLPLCEALRASGLPVLFCADRDAVRAELRVPRDQPVLALGLGRSMGEGAFAALAAGLRARGPGPARILAPAGALPPGPGVVEYPPDHGDPQDYLCAADAVLAKAGYCTIAEAALGAVPLLLLTVEGNAESRALAEEAAALGLAAPPLDLAEAARLLREPEEALRRVAHLRPAQAPAAPAIVATLREEGLL